MDTSRGTKVRVNCITVSPLAQEWTRYDVTDVDGTVTVLAHQNDVMIHYSGPATWRSKHVEFADVTVHQGEQATHDDNCGESPNGDVTDGQSTILDDPWALESGWS